MWTTVLFLILLYLKSNAFALLLPHNIIQKYIQQHSDFSVDPCDDFFAHVCPVNTSGVFMMELEMMKRELVKKFIEQRPELREYTDRFTGESATALSNFIKSNELLKLSSISSSIFKLFARNMLQMTTKEDLDAFKKMGNEQLIEVLRSDSFVLQSYKNSRKLLGEIFSGSVAHVQLKSADSMLRDLFIKIKGGVAKAIRSTPWAQEKGVVELYLKSLEKIKFSTWTDIYAVARGALEMYKGKRKECEKGLFLKLSSDLATRVCDVVALGFFKKALKVPIPNMYPKYTRNYQTDDFEASNAIDENLEKLCHFPEYVYMSNAFILLALTDQPADLYGSVGYSLAHEVMHTFVFDEKDYGWRNKIMPFWTNSSGCVTEQGERTCQTFELNCNNNKTFEEDAADLTAYRIMWDLYKRGLSRKTIVSGYEALNESQMFFYGAGVLFCQKGLLSKLSAQSHASSYQRVNSLMSQMDEFSEAFKCKAADRMVRNKARHCDLYGSGASMTRKSYDNRIALSDY